MPRKLRQLRADLRRAGWRVSRQSGTSHEIWKHPLLPGERVNLAGNDCADAKPYQENDVRRKVRMAEDARRKQKP